MNPTESHPAAVLGHPDAVPYCHLCDCLVGWLHNATEHRRGGYVAHEPFLEDDCPNCWAALANGTPRAD